jgi:threonine dehydratase
VSEDDVAAAMRLLFATTHNVAEPAGALALAGLLTERGSAAGRRVAVILTGGNADADQFRSVLEGHTPAP